MSQQAIDRIRNYLAGRTISTPRAGDLISEVYTAQGKKVLCVSDIEALLAMVATKENA